MEPERLIPLERIMHALGCRPDRYDMKKWHTPVGVISITGEKFFNWNSYSGGGGAVDLVMHLQHRDFTSARMWLRENFSVCPPRAALHELKLPQPNSAALTKVIAYLTLKRSIPLKIVSMLIDCGKLYADDHANAVFLLLGKNKTIVGAELRGTLGIKWHALAPGSKKNLGCFCVKTSPSSTMVLCESAIDAISYHCLYPAHIALSTSGANPHPLWLKSFLNKKLTIFCGFDSDDTGESMARSMIRSFPSIIRLRPPLHDWNDVLKASLHR